MDITLNTHLYLPKRSQHIQEKWARIYFHWNSYFCRQKYCCWMHMQAPVHAFIRIQLYVLEEPPWKPIAWKENNSFNGRFWYWLLEEWQWKRFCRLFRFYYVSFLLPYISTLSRATSHSKTLIDNIFFNNIEDGSISKNIVTTILNHFAQFLLLQNLNNKDSSNSEIYHQDFKNLNKNNLQTIWSTQTGMQLLK